MGHFPWNDVFFFGNQWDLRMIKKQRLAQNQMYKQPRRVSLVDEKMGCHEIFTLGHFPE